LLLLAQSESCNQRPFAARPQPYPLLLRAELDTITGGTAFKLPGAREERARLDAKTHMRARVLEAKRVVLGVQRKHGMDIAQKLAERLGAQLKHEAETIQAQMVRRALACSSPPLGRPAHSQSARCEDHQEVEQVQALRRV
jgi:hypothetical protein